MPKRSIRDELLARRRHLATATCLSHSLAAQQRLLLCPEFAAANLSTSSDRRPSLTFGIDSMIGMGSVCTTFLSLTFRMGTLIIAGTSRTHP